MASLEFTKDDNAVNFFDLRTVLSPTTTALVAVYKNSKKTYNKKF